MTGKTKEGLWDGIFPGSFFEWGEVSFGGRGDQAAQLPYKVEITLSKLRICPYDYTTHGAYRGKKTENRQRYSWGFNAKRNNGEGWVKGVGVAPGFSSVGLGEHAVLPSKGKGWGKGCNPTLLRSDYSPQL